MTQQSEKLMTAQEFWELYGARKSFPKRELVRGEVVEMAPVGGIHGGVAANLVVALHPYVRQNNLGRVMVQTGYRLRRDPDTVSAPDVSFIRAERIPEGLPRGFVEGPPDLAVEVVSPSDTAAEMEGKVHDYLRNGAQRVWVAYSGARRVLAYSHDGTVRWYHEGDNLEDEELLSGFSLPLVELFTC